MEYFAASLPRTGSSSPASADDPRLGQRVVGGQVLLAGPSDADDADAQRRGHAPARSNHARGASGLPATARRPPGRGAAHSIALAMTRWTSGWW